MSTMDYRQMAVDFMSKQAGVRAMSPSEFAAGVASAEEEFRKIYAPEEITVVSVDYVCDPKSAIKDRTITCVCCGKQYKVLTKKHLATHEHTPVTYREFCGYKKGTPLIAKALQRERRNKMKEMRLWEREGSCAQRSKAGITPVMLHSTLGSDNVSGLTEVY